MDCGTEAQPGTKACRAPTSSKQEEEVPLSLWRKLCLEPCETRLRFMTSERGLA